MKIRWKRVLVRIRSSWVYQKLFVSRIDEKRLEELKEEARIKMPWGWY